MKNKKIKILVSKQIVDATIKNDFHYLGGRKVEYVLPNGVTGYTSSQLIKIVEDEKVN
jgi:hypothetical protein